MSAMSYWGVGLTSIRGNSPARQGGVLDQGGGINRYACVCVCGVCDGMRAREYASVQVCHFAMSHVYLNSTTVAGNECAIIVCEINGGMVGVISIVVS